MVKSMVNHLIKILYLVPSLKKVGPTNQLYNLISSLDKTKFDITVITFSNKEQDEEYTKFLNLGLTICQLNFRSVITVMMDVYKLIRVVDQLNPNIIHTHLFRADLISAFFLKRFTRIATVRGEVTSGKHYLQEFGFLQGKLYSWLHALALKKINYVIAVSHAVNYDLKKSAIESTVINNGVDLKKFFRVDQNTKNDLRRKLNINNFNKVFISVGSLIERKRPEILIKSFLEIKNNRYLELLMIGDGTLKSFLEKKYYKYENIKFLGQKDNIANYLQASDYFISTSSAEGLPNSVLEAMGTGLPCILSDIEPHKEILNFDGKFNFLFELDNSKNIILKTNEILEKDYCEISNLFHNNVYYNFNMILMSDKYQQLYMDINKGE